MEQPVRILLLTHGGWGMSLVRSLEMILGKIECVDEIVLEPSHTLQDYLGLVKEYMETVSPKSLIITDLIGGTPSNVAAMVGNQTGVRVLCGLNAPMLLEAVSELQMDGTIDIDTVYQVGTTAVKDVVAEVRKSMS